MRQNPQKHPYHLVTMSPWPFFASFTLLTLVVSMLSFMKNKSSSSYDIILSLFVLLIIAACWWRDTYREAALDGKHTRYVTFGLQGGMLFFIISEIMLFFALFISFFYATIAPTPNIGGMFPSLNLFIISPLGIPLINTCLLLTSGITLTFAHHCLCHGHRKLMLSGLSLTIFLALFFTLFQIFEYQNIQLTISTGVFGSNFFITTGFHGIHVVIGTLFLIICFYRLLKHQMTQTTHIGFELAIWYWHFVDVVWLFLFLFVYCWAAFE